MRMSFFISTDLPCTNFEFFTCRFVYVWDTQSRRILYKLPGHDGSVNDVDFHPKEPIRKFNLFQYLVFLLHLERYELMYHCDT